MKEYEIWNTVDHPNIVKSFGYCIGSNETPPSTSSSTPPSILLEFCPYNLKDKVEMQSDEIRVSIIFEICEAMKHMHSKNFIHRDLKPSNILLDENLHAKICDFGIATLTQELRTTTLASEIGTKSFMAPEMINGDKYNQKVDVYSFGVVVYFILTKGELPILLKKERDLLNGKMANIPNEINDNSKKLIRNCWEFEANKRKSFEDFF